MTESNIADQLQIRHLYAAYTFAVDSHDGEAFVDCFTSDGIIDVTSFGFMRDVIAAGSLPIFNAEGLVVGEKNIRALNLMIPDSVVSLHMTSNIMITRLEGDVAHGKAAFVVFDNSHMESFGSYDDEIARCPDGQWRFKKRRMICRYEGKR